MYKGILKGLFTWAWLTGLARFPRPRVTSKSFVKFSMCLYERAEWILAVRMASSCIACYIFHIISIPFNCSDTALRVAEAMIGAKVKIFVSPCLLCFSNLAPELVPRIFGLLLSQKPCLNFSHEPKGKFISITGPAWSTELMWRGPKKEEKKFCKLWNWKLNPASAIWPF